MSDEPTTDPDAPVTVIDSPIRLDYRYTPGLAQSRFLRGMERGKILGQRCPRCGSVYVPARGSCARCGVATDTDVELPDTGTVTTFCVVNVPFHGQKLKIPYVSATILLDGADIGLMHLIQECDAEEVHMGMRVVAKWRPPAERGPTMESIEYFRPSGEPDGPYDSYRQQA